MMAGYINELRMYLGDNWVEDSVTIQPHGSELSQEILVSPRKRRTSTTGIRSTITKDKLDCNQFEADLKEVSPWQWVPFSLQRCYLRLQL